MRGWMHGLVALATVVVVFSASCHTALGLPQRHDPHEAGQCKQHTLRELADAPALILKDANPPRPLEATWLAVSLLLILSLVRRVEDDRRADIRARIRQLAWIWARGSPITASRFMPIHTPRSETA